MANALTSMREIEREIAAMRIAPGSDVPYLRTSVMTHIAWVPPEWVEAAEDVLTGLAERHPSRTLVLVPQPEQQDGLEAHVDVDVFPLGEGRQIWAETIRIHLQGVCASVPASVVQPLFLPDLPVFLRWRGVPSFGSDSFESLLGVVDRLIIDSTEWRELRDSYVQLAGVFDRVVVSDIAWARTSRWRTQLATLWPGIANVNRLRVTGTAAQAELLAGWLRSRLAREIDLDHRPADRLEAVEIDGKSAPFPPGDPPPPSDLLSEQLDRFEPDRVYEEAVRSASR